MKHFHLLIIACTSITVIVAACKKQDEFLSKKPDIALAVPTSISDCQLLLNYENLLNASDPTLGTGYADEFYAPDFYYSTQTGTYANTYIWAKDIYQGMDPYDYTLPYKSIYYTNVVLDALNNISASTQDLASYNATKGEALFFRAWNFYNLLQTFGVPYNSASAKSDLGIILRLNSDLNAKSVRSSVQVCYDQIINDVKLALQILPSTSSFVTKPSKWAANAFLARIYLGMNEFDSAYAYSNACLSQNGTLEDYNNFPITGNYPLTTTKTYLKEDIFHCTTNFDNTLIGYLGYCDTVLVTSYDSNDLRQQLFYYNAGSSQYYFLGSYDFLSAGVIYTGLATDEMYLIRAESNARKGNNQAAFDDINNLLANRYKSGTYVNKNSSNTSDLIRTILAERKKELVGRGVRWTDLRRLNLDPAYAITLKRVTLGITYTLAPKDPRYTLPLPDQEIQISKVPQNQR